MAPRGIRELTVVVVDVSPTMHADLPVIAQSVTELLHKKVLFSKPGDQLVALQLSGSNATDNELHTELEQENDPDQYLQQQVLLSLHPATADYVRWASTLASYAGQSPSDFMDALSVAQDILVKGKMNQNDKAVLRIILVTDLQSDRCDATDMGSDDAEFLQQLAPSLVDKRIKLEVHFIPRPDTPPDAVARVAAARESLNALTDSVGGEWVEEPASDNMLRAPYAAPVAAMSTSRCELDLGVGLLVPVWIFKATDEAKVPSLKLYCLRDAGEEEADPTHKVLRTTSYKRANEEEGGHVVEEERMPAYRYGKELVPLSKAEVASMKFKPGPMSEDGTQSFKGMQLLGFAAAADVPPTLHMKTAEYVLPVPPNTHPSGLWASGGLKPALAARSAAALSALARALRDQNRVAIVRFVARKGGDLRLCVLTPVISDEGDYLMLNALPFAQDIRAYDFPPLPTEGPLSPSAEALAAAERLVDSMMFGAPGAASDAAAGPPEFAAFAATGDSRLVHNPTLRRFYDFVKRRVLDPAAPVPEWPQGLLPRALASPKALAAVEAFASAAPTRAVELRKRPMAGYFAASDVPEGAQDAKQPREGPSAPYAAAPSGAIRIEDKDPAADFVRELASARGEVERELRVMGVMYHVLRGILDFHGKEGWPKVVEGLRALRRACIDLQSPATFTHGLQIVFEKSAGALGGGAWDAVKEAGLAPITTDEVPSSTASVSPAAAAEFMARIPAAQPAQAQDGHDTEPEDDEFAGMD